MTTDVQLSLLSHPPRPKRVLRETPAWRVAHPTATPALPDLLTVLIGTSTAAVIAERLIVRFNTIQNLDVAPVEELASVKGVGFATAAKLKAALALGRRLLAPPDERVQISSPGDAAQLLQPLLLGREQEFLLVLLLDTRNRVIGLPVEVYHGSLNTSLIRVGEVFKDAIRANAAGVIIAHNHPSGDPTPSPEDVAVTRALREAGKLLDIEVLDHLVIGNPRWVSLKERGLGFN